MPQIHKIRGRREEKKRRRGEEEEATELKRPRPSYASDVENVVDGHQSQDDAIARPPDIPFYGMLDEDDQEYFKRADSMLELNQFANTEERSIFLASVYKEAKGKELKIANSQSCSRLLERLICISTPIQLKALFRIFSGHFLNLSQHRFASHCCETLFAQSAHIVSKELTAPLEDQHDTEAGEEYVSMESLFLYTLDEFRSNLGFLMTDPFASHTLRVLLLIFAGRPLGDATATSIIHSKKKENITMAVQSLNTSELKTSSRNVPGSFSDAVDEMMLGMITGLDTNSLRALTTHPVANPILQLSLEIELSRLKEQKIKRTSPILEKLVPDGSQDDFGANQSFINNLAYDTIGSRMLEIIISNVPEKLFVKLYNSFFKDRIGLFAKNDVSGFVVIRLLERLNQVDLKDAMEHLCPQFELLLERSRTSLIKTLIERCHANSVETEPICNALRRAYGEDPSHRLIKMLNIDLGNMEGLSEDRKARWEKHDTARVHGSLLAQSMLSIPGPFRQFIADGLMAMDTDMLISIAKDRAASRTLQSSLAVSDQTLIFRRVLLQRFYGHMTDLAVDTIASHVVDEFWAASTGLAFIRERIAVELLQNEEALRGSFSGRVVWRNWNMDVYKTKKNVWISNAREKDGSKKSGIELARARYANAKKENMAKVVALKPQGFNKS